MAKQSSNSPTPKAPPKLCRNAQGIAFVYIDRKKRYFGRYDDPATHAAYHRWVADQCAGGPIVREASPRLAPGAITIEVLLARFLEWAGDYYRRPDGSEMSDLSRYRRMAKVLRRRYAAMEVDAFTPITLETIQHDLVKEGWYRESINVGIRLVVNMFKWAGKHGLCKAETYAALLTVEPIRKGRTTAKESEPIRPVSLDLVTPLEKFVSPQIWAMIQLQLKSAARSGELMAMKRGEIDTSGDVWLYRPATHKTAHKGRERVIPFNEAAQAVLKPYMDRPADAYMFSPAEAVAALRAKRAAARTTPPECGNHPGTNRTTKPKTKPGPRYSKCGYLQAVKRAVLRAFPLPDHLAQGYAKRPDLPPDLAKLPGENDDQWHARLGWRGMDRLREFRAKHHRKQRRETEEQWRERLEKEGYSWSEVEAWIDAHTWHPHQLRHNALTAARKVAGLEAARALGGHASMKTTEIYAEMDTQKAIDAVRRIA